MLNLSKAEWIHIDVMDGVFVPNISFGFPVLQSVSKYATKTLDVHLMIVNPENYIERFAAAGADIIVFHAEATEDHKAVIEKIKQCGAKAGISIKPATPVKEIEQLLPFLDVVLIMSVEPGFGGQLLHESSYDKVREVKEMIAKSGSKVLVQVDGGVTMENAHALFEAGVDVLVAGSAVFSAEDPLAAIETLLNA